jgi:hypothetical protein
MTDNNSDGNTNLQESIKEHHRQASLHPEDPEMLMDSASGKGYSQKRLDPSEQSSLAGEPAGVPTPEQRSLTGEEESRKAGGQKVLVPIAIAFVLGLLVALLIFRTFSATSQGAKESPARDNIAASPEVKTEEPAVSTDVKTQEQETTNQEDVPIDPDAVVDIPDPVLKKAIQDTLGIGNRDITGADALSLTKLRYDGDGKEKIKDITGLSAFTNLTSLSLCDNQLTDISALAGLTNLKKLDLYNN